MLNPVIKLSDCLTGLPTIFMFNYFHERTSSVLVAPTDKNTEMTNEGSLENIIIKSSLFHSNITPSPQLFSTEDPRDF